MQGNENQSVTDPRGDNTLEGELSKPYASAVQEVEFKAGVNVLDLADSEISPDVHDNDIEDDDVQEIGIGTKNISIQNTTINEIEFDDITEDKNKTHLNMNKDVESQELTMNQPESPDNVTLPAIKLNERLNTHSKFETNHPTSVSPQQQQQIIEGNATMGRASRENRENNSRFLSEDESIKIIGGAHGAGPSSNPMHINALINPDNLVLDEAGDPLDYFNIYKRKMQQLARERFDKNKDDDKMFFNYLDRLVNAEEYKQRERINGMGILKEFVTDHESLSYVKKRNDIDRRWEFYRNDRIEKGLPPDPVQIDPAYIKMLMDGLKRQMTKRALPQKSFHPDLDDESKRGNTKNFITAQKYGQNRDYRPPWKDPNPLKYGGKYGMQNMKEMLDTQYIRGRDENVRRNEFERKAGMTLEERAEAERMRQEMELYAEANKLKLTDLNIQKQYDNKDVNNVHPRSFLIQPDKAPKSRMPSIFSGDMNSPSNQMVSQMMNNFPGELMTSDRSGKFVGMNKSPHGSSIRILNNQTTHKYLEKVDTIGTIDGSQGFHPSNSNTSFELKGTKQKAFGKRSQSMAQPGMSVYRGPERKSPYESYYMLDDPSREALDEYKSMLMRQGSSKYLLGKIQSEYSNMQSINVQNDEKAVNNIEAIKTQIMEPNTQIMNPPIEERYDHKKFNAESNIEQTVILSFALEEMRKNPKYQQLTQKRGSKCVYKMRHGANSPAHNGNDKSQIFDTLTKDLRIAQTQRKESKLRLPYPNAEDMDDEQDSRSGKISQLRSIRHAQTSGLASQRSSKTIKEDAFADIWNKPFYVVFVKDGSRLSNKKTLNAKVNISKFIKKYMIEPPKYIARLPDSYIKSQQTFFERAYLELLEYCNEHFNPAKKEEDLNPPVEFKSMFTTDGKHLKTIADIQEFILTRTDQQPTYGSASNLSSYNSISARKLTLPAIGNAYGSVQQLNSPIEITDHEGDQVVKKVKKAQFISYQPSEQQFDLAPQLNMQSISQLSNAKQDMDKNPPPIILVSQSEDQDDFIGIEAQKAGLTARELRIDNASQVKQLQKKQQEKWGSKRFLDWIETNLESGHSETQNMEYIIKKDTQLKYANTNDAYRHQIVQKLKTDTNPNHISKETLFKPVYLGGGLNPQSRFLQPIAEDGTVDQLRGKYRSTLDQPMPPPKYTGLQLDFSSKFLPQASNVGSQETLHQPQHQHHTQESPSKLSLLHDQGQWNQEFVDQVDALKQQYLEKEYAVKTDRNHRISPDKKNFEGLSYQQSQEHVGTDRDRQKYASQIPVMNREQKMAASMKKVSVNLNLNMTEEMEQRLAKSLTKRPAKRVEKEYVSKNIPHLNIDKKHNQAKIDHKEVAQMSEKFNLPVTVIYNLQTEYQSLEDLKNEKENVDLKILGGKNQELTKDDSSDDNEIDQEGIPVAQFVESFQPLKEKHKQVVDMIFVALGVTKGYVDLNQYIKFNSILKYYSPSPEVFLEFWMKFFNPKNLPQLTKQELVQSLELLARGRMTSGSTLISESFAQGFFEMLKQKKCAGKAHGVVYVDMIKFRKKIVNGEIDINYLNQCLKSDSDFSTEGMLQVQEGIDGKSKTLGSIGEGMSSNINTMNTLGNFESQKSEPQVEAQ